MKMNSTSGRRSEGVKIVQIETRYVQTDAVNFRDVVQSLTGNNSSMASWASTTSNNINMNIIDANYNNSVTLKPQQEITTTHVDRNGNGSNDHVSLSSMLLNNVSFKDFDSLLFNDVVLPPAYNNNNDLPAAWRLRSSS